MGLKFPTKWFLPERRQTVLETVVWHGQKGERGEMREGGVGVVNLTVPLFTPEFLPSPPREEGQKNQKHTRTSEAPRPAGGPT